jgi:hypothetical protein
MRRRVVDLIVRSAVVLVLGLGSVSLASSAGAAPAPAQPVDTRPTPVSVARALFSTVTPDVKGQPICLGSFTDCPATPELVSALASYQRGADTTSPGFDAYPLCRCTYGIASSVTFSKQAKVPRALHARRDIAVVRVRLDYDQQYSVFVLVQKQSKRAWTAFDTYCAPAQGSTSASSNRMTTGHAQPCAGSTGGAVGAVRTLFATSTDVQAPPAPACGYVTTTPGSEFGGKDFTNCPVTPELAAALHADSMGADPLCRCQQAAIYSFASGGPLPAAFTGKADYKVATVEVDFEFSPPGADEVLFALVQRQDRKWVVADTYCNASPGDQDPYANRMTVANHQLCAAP